MRAAAMSRPKGYPWKRWFDGNVHVITRGLDFDLTVDKMRNQLTQRAFDHDVAIDTRADGDRIAFVTREKPQERLKRELAMTAYAKHINEHARAWGLR